MIEGLKVTVGAEELKSLCEGRAEYHKERGAVYADNLRNMESAEIEGMNYSGGDPKKAMRDKRDQHAENASEMRFIAEHLKDGEEYLLDRQDLSKLGISSSGLWFN